MLATVVDESRRNFNSGFNEEAPGAPNPPEMKLVWPNVMTNEAATHMAKIYAQFGAQALSALPSRLLLAKAFASLQQQDPTLQEREMQPILTTLRMALTRRQ
jgi:hypothetical protein